MLATVLGEAWDFQLGWEWTNPLAYFNLGAFVVGLFALSHLRNERGASGTVDGAWWAALVVTVGSGLHVLGDLTGVPEYWDHQFIHAVVLLAMVALFLGTRKDR